jgi:hypothetical protein
MSGSRFMVLASCQAGGLIRQRSRLFAFYGKTVIHPYGQAQNSVNPGHGGAAKWEKCI